MAKVSKRQTARVSRTGRSQAVRLPKEFRFDTDTVFVRREGSSVIQVFVWSPRAATAPPASFSIGEASASHTWRTPRRCDPS